MAGYGKLLFEVWLGFPTELPDKASDSDASWPCSEHSSLKFGCLLDCGLEGDKAFGQRGLWCLQSLSTAEHLYAALYRLFHGRRAHLLQWAGGSISCSVPPCRSRQPAGRLCHVDPPHCSALLALPYAVRSLKPQITRSKLTVCKTSTLQM